MMIRQGDLLLVKIDSIPESAKKQKKDDGLVVLAYGEITGHMHAIAEKNVCKLQDLETEYLEVMEEAYLRHGTKEQIQNRKEIPNADHAEIKLPVGEYRIIHQREYTPERIRRVQD